jgi:hypothetical protein
LFGYIKVHMGLLYYNKKKIATVQWGKKSFLPK